MRIIWHRIEVWLKGNAPTVFDALRPGATKELIERTESILETRLPNDVKESYQIHDGQSVDPTDGAVFGLIDGYELLSLESLTEVWSGWKRLLTQRTFEGIQSEPSGPIRPVWWNNSWIPVADNGHGDNYCVDLDPAPGGSVGQVISVWHDHPRRDILAPNFRQWLEEFARQLEGGFYVFSEDYGGIMKKDDI